MAAKARYGAPTGGAVELTSNFRTVEAVTDWVNATFANLLGEAPAVTTPGPSQPAYLALAAHHRGAPDGPPMAVVGRGDHPVGTKADAVRSAEAAEVAATVVRALDEAWTVQGEDGGWRPARLGDITVLVPARTSLPFLEDELGRAGIPFRAESSSLVYASRAVRDVMMVLRAVDDPTDHLRVVSALRTPLFACGDDDLHRFRVERHGSWSYLADQPATVPADDPVGAGLAYLRRLHDSRHWRAPSEVLDQVIRDRRVLELEAADPRARDVWRRLRFVVDQARAWSDAAGGGLRDYVQWVERQGTDGIRVAEAVLPETDDDAVRIMTIHAAKGLEFPVTIVSGLSTQPQRRPAPAEVVWTDDGVGYRVAGGVQTDEWQEYAAIDEQMSADERKRLLYVACTRARDHLVVSLHRVERKKLPDANKRTNAELLVDAMGPRLDALPEVVATGEDILGPLAPTAPVAGIPADWAATRDAALERASRPVAVAAAALTADGEADAGGATDGEGAGGTVEPGLQKRPRDLDLPPWLKGRYGTAVGRAVHGVLQTVDRATDDGLDAAVAAQCEAEAVPDRAGDVATLARHALGSPVVREAASLPHWRELYVATPLDDGQLLEGYVDLLYRRDDGLVVVDYKTAATADPRLLQARVDGYRWQGRAYARAVAAVTGEAVAGVVFLFLTPDGAVEWPDGGGGDQDGSDAGHVGPVVTH